MKKLVATIALFLLGPGLSQAASKRILVCAQELPDGKTGYRVNLNESNGQLKALLSMGTFMTSFAAFDVEKTALGFEGTNGRQGFSISVALSQSSAQNTFVRGVLGKIVTATYAIHPSTGDRTIAVKDIPVVCGSQISSYK